MTEQYLDGEMTTLNRAGLWVPSIPLPYTYGFSRVGCSCGEKFWSIRAYRGHYALEHILELD